MSIFVSLASYRDSELPFTIKSMLENADYPENLHIGIVQQSTKSERIDFSTNSHVSEIWIPAQNARGAGFARAEAQKMYNNEHWFLQIDSHTRFDNGWDTSFIDMYNQVSSATGNEKIVLSHFPRAYIHEGNKDIYLDTRKYPATPHKQYVHWFGTLFSGLRIPFNDPFMSMPEEAETILAGTVFAPGRIVNDVPYDPNISFFGEELCFSIRAWTRGWRIYAPNKMITSHFYSRRGHNKIWDSRNNTKGKWEQIEHESMLRQHKVYTGELTGVWGAKDSSSLTDYYDYIMQDPGQIYTKYLEEKKMIENKQVESDIFAGMVMPSLSPLCIRQSHKECTNKQCECPCHSN